MKYHLATILYLVLAATINLAWDQSTGAVAGYRIRYGIGALDQAYDAGPALTATLELGPGAWRFVAVAYDAAGVESSPSNEISTVVVADEHSLTASPALALPGSLLVITWSAPSGRPVTDWVALYKVGDPNTSFGWWKYTQGGASGTFTLTAPTQNGNYEFRYLVNDGFMSVASSNPVTVGFPPPPPPPPVISSVIVSAVSADGATIVWRTDVPADGLVTYWIAGSAPANKASSGLVENHVVNLDGLQSGQVYRFKVSSGGTEVDGGTFAAAKPPKGVEWGTEADYRRGYREAILQKRIKQ